MAEGDDEDERNAGQADTGDEGEGEGNMESDDEEFDPDPQPPRPSATPATAITPHFGLIPQGRVWAMMTMKVPGVPGMNRNCKMGFMPLIEVPEGFERDFPFAWVNDVTLYWNNFYRRWLRLPRGWMPLWHEDTRFPTDSEEHVRDYFNACCDRLSRLQSTYPRIEGRSLVITLLLLPPAPTS
ncbi:hypothetical protein DFP72DRAFT_1068181 [Ephemerocybe angulata]|uniref:Uncharacterized protein n=1 Tax=Ephemerocybe angulata TaxID=980116 RepID=A0A8H6HXI0_9AGAR|nr:hypothetical protein DFP72DRAFT_1068181 [Tulosesus angulatus]